MYVKVYSHAVYDLDCPYVYLGKQDDVVSWTGMSKKIMNLRLHIPKFTLGSCWNRHPMKAQPRITDDLTQNPYLFIVWLYQSVRRL